MTEPLCLDFPVVTLDGLELLPAGTALTEQVMAELAAAGRSVPHRQVPLLDFGTVRADLLRCLTIPPYDEVFADPPLVEHLLAQMQSVRLPLPLLEVLAHFRGTDFPTYRHILSVFSLVILVADQVLPDYHNRPAEVLAGPTHDIGKLCIPRQILRKSSPLTRQERRILYQHPLAGYVLLTYYFGDHRHPAAAVARDHHERQDGSGYPRGIDTLTPVVELVATCDIYDALLAPRPYRPLSFDNRTALEELTSLAGSGKLGWDCVAALVARNRKGRPVGDRVVVSLDRRGVPPAGNCHGLLADADAEG